jgi:hypothetical protein
MKKPLKRLFIVGIPRSGSTLMAALVDSLENSLCMSEPPELFIEPSAESCSNYVKFAVDSLDSYRSRVIAGDVIVDRRNADGAPTTNYMRKRFLGRGREFRPTKGLIDTAKYDKGMLIAIKHNIPFLAVLPDLVRTDVPILGVVRNPVTTILSWAETGLPVAKGRMPSAAAFWPEINSIMDASETLEVGWARIYDALCERLLTCHIPIFKYEDVTADISSLESFVGRDTVCHVPITLRNKGDYQNFKRAETIARALRNYAPNAMRLYRDV